MTKVKSLVQNNENILTDYEEQSNRLKLTKQIRELESIRRAEQEEEEKQESRRKVPTASNRGRKNKKK
jgi:hypothetical protein